jgi:prepilin-type N-terminal cleavage/methylation domain-containing protein
MIKREDGFSLVELMITMVVFVFVIAAASQVFTGLLTQFKQQSKIAETNIEGIVGLEILRRDIEHAGYGLPWNVTGANWSDLPNYIEAESISCTPNTNDFDDAPNNAPKAILSRNNASFSGCGANSIFNGSDYLVIKAVNITRSDTTQRWTRLRSGNEKRNGLSGDNFDDTDRVIVISPGSTDANGMALVAYSSGGTTYWHTTYDATSNFAPADETETRVIYGLDPLDTTGEPYTRRMPFNRADYYIWRNSTSTATDEVPDRCAPNTGVLRKAVISQKNGQRENPLPLLDCVADMQVVFGLDTDATPDNVINCYVNNLADSLATVDAENIRNRIKEVRVYILAHEGQIDRAFTFTPPIPASSIRVGESSAVLPGGSCTGVTVLGRDFDLSGITNWQNYRWKVYTLVVKPNNLR